jgi:NADPH:quinone reductase-like Zn-dependent oxidoreductase
MKEKLGMLLQEVSEVFPLQEAGRAQEKLEQREHFGKVVLAID